MAAVTLENVKKVYPGNVTAVRDFNLEIADGEFIVLVGPSGCGKSTTLRMVAGLEEITEGTIKIGERVVNNVPPKDRDIAMVFQNYALYPHMTVRENMAFGLKLRKFPKREIEERIAEVSTTLGLEEMLERRPKALSGGQRQRVALGRAIVRKPEVFLFDEPLSNLDAKLRVQMRVELSRLHARLKTTMIYVTHDQVEAMTMGERIVVMKDGDMLQADTPLQLYNHPKKRFVAGFIGTPPMNFIEGRIAKRGDELVFRGPGGFEMGLPGGYRESVGRYCDKEITLGIRPEDIGSTTAEQSSLRGEIRAVVDVVETMGAETFIHLRLEETSFISRVDAQRQFKVGEEIAAAIDLNKIHFFDPVSEDVIP